MAAGMTGAAQLAGSDSYMDHYFSTVLKTVSDTEIWWQQVETLAD